MTELATSDSYLFSPITEAVIEVRVANVMNTDDVDKIANKLANKYTNKVNINSLGVHVNQEQNGTSLTVNQDNSSFRLSSDDQTDVAIVSINGLITARLAPYLGWGYLSEKFIENWKTWKKTTHKKTTPISSLTIRTVNRIDVPLNSGIALDEYLCFYPNVPNLDDSPIEEYLVQVTKKITDTAWNTTIISTIVPSPLIGMVSLILDINVFRVDHIPLNDEDLFSVINEARDIKNDIFKKCVTSKTMEMIK